METEISYGVCRGNLGDDTTNAQYRAFKNLVREKLENTFPDADITVVDSDFANTSTCSIINRGSYRDGDTIITRDDVEEAVSDIGESWWDEI